MRLSDRQAGGRRLLLVEEDPHIIDELRDLFASRLFECEVALSVETALQILNERRMDCIVIDAAVDAIPSSAVPPLIKRLRERDEEMHIVVFNGISRKATQRKMRRLGADGYLSKKSDLAAVARSVRRVLGMEEE